MQKMQDQIFSVISYMVIKYEAPISAVLVDSLVLDNPNTCEAGYEND